MTRDEQLDYLAGFFDAEGCIKISLCRGRHQMGVDVSQCNPNILYLYRELFGGSVFKRSEANDRHREGWKWIRSIQKGDEFVALMQGRAGIKAYVIELASMFEKTLKSTGGRNKKDKTPKDIARCMLTEEDIRERQAIKIMLHRANHGAFDEHEVSIPPRSAAYWAGLFDGDGNVRAAKDPRSRVFSPTVWITSAYRPILECSKQQFGGSVYGNYRGQRAKMWGASHGPAEKFLRAIEPFVICKAPVVRLMIELREIIKNTEKINRYIHKNSVRVFPDSAIDKMQEIVAETKRLNRLGPERKVA